jgi:DUF971 family protein
MNKYPVKIRKKDSNTLEIEWNNGDITDFPIKLLRDECPCVNCKGEAVIFDKYIPIKSPFKAAGFYEIDKIVPVGNYAIQIIWKDGHDTGIYSWEVLRQIEEKLKSNNQ